MMKRTFIYSFVLFSLIFASCTENKNIQSTDESEIKAAALNYFEGWYSRDTVRLDLALHPELAKRRKKVDEQGNEYIYSTTKEILLGKLIEKAREEGKKEIDNNNLMIQIKIFDIHNDVASALIESKDYYDYIHLIKYNNEWKIINVLWERKPKV